MEIQYTSGAASFAASLLASSPSWAALSTVPTVFSSADAQSRPSDHGKHGPKEGKRRLGIGASAGPPPPEKHGGVLGKRLSRDGLKKQRRELEEAEAARKAPVEADDDDDVRCGPLFASSLPFPPVPHLLLP